MSNTMPDFVVDYGGVGDGTTLNDAAFAAAEADSKHTAIWVPDGVFKTTKTQSQLHKHYWGRGQIITGDAGSSGANWALPPNSSYADAIPTGYAAQGNSGWFAGDQTFSDGGEWKVVGPDARTYSLSQKYYMAQLTPHHAWFDIYSGNSGGQALMTSGASAGQTTITLNGAASAEWVGKTAGFTQVSSIGGNPSVSVLETHTVTAVSGNTIAIDAPLSNNYPWNPTAGQSPSVVFSPRTMSTHTYIKVNHNGGGDGYGHLVRLNVGYVPKPTETHTYMTACGGQYGGDINYQSDGVRATGWESQYIDNGHDVGAIAQVDTFARTNDTAPPGSGRTWLGCLLKSGGTRPIDAAYVWNGLARNGLDTAFGTMMETAQLAAATTAGGTTVAVTSTNGALVGDPIQVGDGPSYSGTITSVGAGSIGVSPALPSSSIASGTIVKYLQGGAAINMGFGQRIVFNSSASNNGRGGDPSGVFGSLYGNVQGDIVMETNTDSTSDYWAVRFTGAGHGGSTARLQLRPTQLSCNVQMVCSAGLSVTGPATITGSAAVSGSLSAGDIGSSGDIGTTKTQGQVYVPTGGAVRFNGKGGDTYLTADANNVYLVKHGSIVATW